MSAEAAETYERIEFLKEKVGDGEQGRVAIQRRLPDGTLANLPSLPIKTFDVDLVAEKYGGGKYEVRFYKGSQYLGYESFTIDPSVQAKKEPEPVAASGSGASEGALVVLVQGMLAELKEMRRAPPAPAAAPIDPMAMIRAIGETMKSLTPAPLPPPPAPPPAPGLAEQLALVESVVNVGTKIIDARGGGEGGSGDMYMGAVEKLAEPITDLVKLRVQQEADRRRVAPPRGRAALPPPRNAVTPPAAAPAATGGQPVGNWLAEIQKWVPMIGKRARTGKSAEDTAFFILDELSEPTLQELAKIAAMPDFGTQVARILPAELSNYPEWTTEFLAAVQDWLFGGDEGTAEDEEPEEPKGGGDEQPEVEVVEEPKVFDLDAEAKRRMALLDDAPPKEPAPTG